MEIIPYSFSHDSFKDELNIEQWSSRDEAFCCFVEFLEDDEDAEIYFQSVDSIITLS